MANASCSTCTLVSNVLTVSGAVSGTIVVGMTITAASVPPGVTITSFGTGTGQAGTYNCSSSSANIPAVEPMVFSLDWLMPLVSNAGSSQIVDMAIAAGLATIFLASPPGPTAAMGQEYQFGTHQIAIHNAQAISGTRVFPAAKGLQGRSVVPTILTQGQYPEPRAPLVIRAATVPSAVHNIAEKQLYASPQLFDFTVQGQIVAPLVPESLRFLRDYFVQAAPDQTPYFYQSQGQVWSSLIKPPTGANLVPLQTIIANPQELARDLTIQGWSSIPSVAQGWIITMIQAGPQLADLTMQAVLSPARPFQSPAPPAPLSPRTIISVMQEDPKQLMGQVFKPSPRPAVNLNPAWFFASQADPTQIQPQIFQRKIAGGQRQQQPVYVKVGEQAYINPPSATFKPLVFIAPPPPPSPLATFFTNSTQEQFYVNPPFVPTSSPIIFTPPPPVLTTQPGQFGDRVILPAKKLGETVFIAIDFISKLGVGETIIGAVCTCTVYTGNDPNPSAVISGVAQVSGTIVDQLVRGGVLGTIYEILAKATTSLGQTVELSGFLAIVPDLP